MPDASDLCEGDRVNWISHVPGGGVQFWRGYRATVTEIRVVRMRMAGRVRQVRVRWDSKQADDRWYREAEFRRLDPVTRLGDLATPACAPDWQPDWQPRGGS